MSRALYGTDEPLPARRELRAGPAEVTLEDGQLRHLSIGGVEAIRGVMFLVRDRDWGTVPAVLSDLTVEETPDAVTIGYDADYEMGTGRLHARITLRLDAMGLDCHATARAHGEVWTNRTGFTVLHPIEGVAGAAVTVTHPDGSETHAHMPDLIAPWQPFQQIAALTHHAAGWRVACKLEGDVFEMEDQRQWGDASFKTYNRPLALPWPYSLPEGPALDQRVRIRWHPAPAVACVPSPRLIVPQPRFPETALALTAAEARRALDHPQDLSGIRPQRLLCHLDATQGPLDADLAAFVALQAPFPDMEFDLELIAACPGTADPAPELAAHGRALAASGMRAASVMVTPAVDRQSVPPGSDWPPCPPADRIASAARAAFPGLALGGGVASFFPELNRKRPPEGLDFVTHGLCPIVHAADDLSVIETLQAVPHILASARAIIGGAGYRLGPSTIAMRQNPYGSRTIGNPDRRRICMADDDPRQDGAFAAAYAIGLAAAIAPSGVTVWTPASLYGPRGLWRDDGTARPVAKAVAALARLAGRPVGRAEAGPEAVLEAGDTRITANLTPRPGRIPPFGWTIKDLRAAASAPR
ncbi:hypothetical protein [Paracoccus sp. NSM]|uniref:hypothetical protein n=1 Tax=Paracoccus sp. NSM TaxID=3457784 RepID=UPI0040358E1D